MIKGAVTLLVLVSDRSAMIAALAAEHAAFDPSHRRVLLQNAQPVAAPPTAAALLFDLDGRLCDILDETRAMNEAWIEDAFVRASRAYPSALLSAWKSTGTCSEE
jgi:hypothetical protein